MTVTKEMEEEKKVKVIAIRVTQEQFDGIKRAVKEKHINKSTLGRVLFELFLRQEVNI